MNILNRLISIFDDSMSALRQKNTAEIDSEDHSQEIYLSNTQRIIKRLETSGGRMKQADLVPKTGLSKSTVSRVVSQLEEDGDIYKISVGRENLITLADSGPKWYTPPDVFAESTTPGEEFTAKTTHEPAILLVEDDPHDARFLKEAFEEVNITNPVHVVRNGVDALEFLLQRGIYTDAPTPGLVLLDLTLMAVGGIEVLKELKERDALHGVPILVLSGSDAPENICNAYEQGAAAYLTKPKNLEGFVELVKSIDAFWLSQVVSHASSESHSP